MSTTEPSPIVYEFPTTNFLPPLENPLTCGRPLASRGSYFQMKKPFTKFQRLLQFGLLLVSLPLFNQRFLADKLHGTVYKTDLWDTFPSLRWSNMAMIAGTSDTSQVVRNFGRDPSHLRVRTLSQEVEQFEFLRPRDIRVWKANNRAFKSLHSNAWKCSKWLLFGCKWSEQGVSYQTGAERKHELLWLWQAVSRHKKRLLYKHFCLLPAKIFGWDIHCLRTH